MIKTRTMLFYVFVIFVLQLTATLLVVSIVQGVACGGGG